MTPAIATAAIPRGPLTVTLQLNPSAVSADGVSTVVAEALVKDANGSPVPRERISISVSDGDAALWLAGAPMYSSQTIAGGTDHVCALLRDASVRCWGSNFWGMFGNGANGNWSRDPVAGRPVSPMGSASSREAATPA